MTRTPVLVRLRRGVETGEEVVGKEGKDDGSEEGVTVTVVR